MSQTTRQRNNNNSQDNTNKNPNLNPNLNNSNNDNTDIFINNAISDKRNRNTIKFLHWNAQGLNKKAKVIEFKKFVQFHKFDIIALNETHWQDGRKTLALKGYTKLEKNRPLGDQWTQASGGVAIFHRNNIDVQTTTI